MKRTLVLLLVAIGWAVTSLLGIMFMLEADASDDLRVGIYAMVFYTGFGLTMLASGWQGS